MSDKIGAVLESRPTERDIDSANVIEKAFEISTAAPESDRVSRSSEVVHSELASETSKSSTSKYDIVSNGFVTEVKKGSGKVDDSETWGHDLEAFEEKIQ
ncbi:MAG: hypothetical protein NT141_02585 [candidate division WWE3 bacterium]|nr:hypothetical protein [candidate division WWE3 bacterium]